MYLREQIPLNISASALCNNLSALTQPDARETPCVALIHRSVVKLVEQVGKSNYVKQVVWKEALATKPPMVLQIYNKEGTILLFWHTIKEADESGEKKWSKSGGVFAKGIADICPNIVCVGTSSGKIFVFAVPDEGYGITHEASLTGHSTPISSLASWGKTLASGEDTGEINVWRRLSNNFERLCTFRNYGTPCTSMGLWDELLLAGYGSGYIRLFNINTSSLLAEALSASEDSFIRIWQLRKEGEQISHVRNECLTDNQICGACFLNHSGTTFAAAGYDNEEITYFYQTFDKTTAV